jgi:hypothetical protein
MRVLNSRTQKLSDFQPLCKHCNDVKRDAIKKMEQDKRRPSAIDIPIFKALELPSYTHGNEHYDILDPNWAIGTYWYDPIAFMNASKLYTFKNN